MSLVLHHHGVLYRMLVTIPGVLDATTLKLLQDALARAPFVDGKLTAGKAAAKVKNNLELDRHASERDRLNRVAMGALTASQSFQHAALPLRIATPFYFFRFEYYPCTL